MTDPRTYADLKRQRKITKAEKEDSEEMVFETFLQQASEEELRDTLAKFESDIKDLKRKLNKKNRREKKLKEALNNEV